MKNRILLILCLVIWCFSNLFAQKIDIPQNRIIKGFIEDLPKKLKQRKLTDLRKKQDFSAIRIWQQHETVTLSYNPQEKSTYQKHTYNNKHKFCLSTFDIDSTKSKLLLDSIFALNPSELITDENIGIDGYHVYIEISTKETYKVLYYWSPRSVRNENHQKVVAILKSINNNLAVENYTRQFIASLEVGEYHWGMLGMSIDKFVEPHIKTTDLYQFVEQKLKSEFSIKDNTNFPLILIDQVPQKMAVLNKYTKAQIAHIKIFKPNDMGASLYGSRGIERGVILITL
jgi:hypothetical protein